MSTCTRTVEVDPTIPEIGLTHKQRAEFQDMAGAGAIVRRTHNIDPAGRFGMVSWPGTARRPGQMLGAPGQG
jgi:hypothetical protein